MTLPSKRLLATLPLLLLVACAGGPTDAEVEAAMKARINEMDPGPEAPVATAAKNLGCTAGSTDGTYTCEVEVEMSMPPMGAVKNVMRLDMVQVDDKWTYGPGVVQSVR